MPGGRLDQLLASTPVVPGSAGAPMGVLAGPNDPGAAAASVPATTGTVTPQPLDSPDLPPTVGSTGATTPAATPAPATAPAPPGRRPTPPPPAPPAPPPAVRPAAATAPAINAADAAIGDQLRNLTSGKYDR